MRAVGAHFEIKCSLPARQSNARTRANEVNVLCCAVRYKRMLRRVDIERAALAHTRLQSHGIPHSGNQIKPTHRKNEAFRMRALAAPPILRLGQQLAQRADNQN